MTDKIGDVSINFNRKPVFDAVRTLMGRGFTADDIRTLDEAINHSLKTSQVLSGGAEPYDRSLGALSEVYESGGKGPGAVSSGQNDAGGVSYGIWQLASKTGTCAAFIANEGARWKAEFGGNAPGTDAFSRVWKAIAEREGEAFANAQHAFIKRTHYQPAVDAVLNQTGLILDLRHPAVRDATWSVAVQHGGAAKILVAAVKAADTVAQRTSGGYDKVLVEKIYAERTSYVLGVANNTTNAGNKRALISITQNRYPSELKAALKMFA